MLKVVTATPKCPKDKLSYVMSTLLSKYVKAGIDLPQCTPIELRKLHMLSY